jgi:hypothetical protein
MKLRSGLSIGLFFVGLGLALPTTAQAKVAESCWDYDTYYYGGYESITCATCATLVGPYMEYRVCEVER